MKKLKIYLDTSVISHLKQDDAPEKTADTLKLWEDIKQGKYDVYTSETTLTEMYKCSQPKQSIMVNSLAEIAYTKLYTDSEIEYVAKQIINLGILTQKSYDDCLHIATAVVNECDIIVSWNFKHLVNIKTIKGVRAIAEFSQYKSIDILQPTILLEDKED